MLSAKQSRNLTNHQWASGEKNWKKVIDLGEKTDCRDIEKMMDEVYLCEYEGGLFNGGAAQLRWSAPMPSSSSRAVPLSPS